MTVRKKIKDFALKLSGRHQPKHRLYEMSTPQNVILLLTMFLLKGFVIHIHLFRGNYRYYESEDYDSLQN